MPLSRAKHVRRDLPSHGDEGGGCVLMLVLLLVLLMFFALMGVLALTDNNGPEDKAKAAMISRCAKDKEPPAYCNNILLRKTP